MQPSQTRQHSPRGVLAWPAWMRVLAVVPVLVLLWCAVLWASAELIPL